MALLNIRNNDKYNDIPDGYFNSMPCEYIESCGFERAYSLLESHKNNIHTIIMNYNDAMTDGKFLDNIAKHDSFRHIPLILTLNRGQTDHNKSFKHSSPYQWLHVPVEQSVLNAMVLSSRNEFLHHQDLRQEINKRESIIGTIKSGTFRIKTLEQANALTTMLSVACPEDPDRIAFGLFELLANAIEHGNLDISSEQKLHLVGEGLLQKEIDRRLGLPQYRDRYVDVTFERLDSIVTFSITDQGEGFNHENYQHIDLSTNQTYHGRGIALARATSFDYMEYLGSGNKVLAIAKFNAP